ncbi:hypothetical protein [Methanoregula formicica]|uniref:Uncharacterized protein n=1 Tax=Methanoregula formicica (strain DSM 22288 / NBRC 105244 / SMSP) TaxID=593750 RepID=L0HHT3_METFS|nr:hypothetical protein [Methanoregula formicica]AGB02883.1 hypothetical protein Metfor_1862 [Methanoregula formicica SMSP]
MQDHSSGRSAPARLILALIALTLAGIILAGAFIMTSATPASPVVCYHSADDCIKTCTDQGWKTGQGGSCETACAGWEEAKCPARDTTQAAVAGYTQCTSGCVRTNVVYISPTGPQNPGDDVFMQECREKSLQK